MLLDQERCMCAATRLIDECSRSERRLDEERMDLMACRRAVVCVCVVLRACAFFSSSSLQVDPPARPPRKREWWGPRILRRECNGADTMRMGQDASANLDPLTGNINVKKTGTMSLIQLFTVVRTDTTLDLSQKAEKVSRTKRKTNTTRGQTFDVTIEAPTPRHLPARFGGELARRDHDPSSRLNRETWYLNPINTATL